MSGSPAAVTGSPTQLYIETTAAAGRIFGLQQTQAALQKIFGSAQLISSGFVWGEFRRTFVKDAIVCHNVFLNAMVRKQSFGEALKRLRDYDKIRFRPRALDRVWDIIGTISDPPLKSVDDAVDRLEKYIRYDLKVLFFHRLEPLLVDLSDCKMTAVDALKTELPGHTGYYIFDLPSSCSMAKPPACQIVAFWQHHRAELEKIALMHIPAAGDKQLIQELTYFKTNAAELLQTLDEKPSTAFGRRCHSFLADVVIVLEAPESAQIVTSNEAHYAPICAALGRPSPIAFR